jgi:hypothetical protein
MFFHLLYIHLFRPFLKYNPTNSPLPSHVSPRKLCTQAAGAISKLMRLYKRTYGCRQICNIAVYIVHSACTIHLLNLPEKTAKRDIVHGVKHLEEIAEDWLCARRTLSILSVLGRKWKIDLPEEAATVLARTDVKFGYFSTSDVPSPKQELVVATPPSTIPPSPQMSRAHIHIPNSIMNPNQLRQSIYSYPPEAMGMNGGQQITQNPQTVPMSGSMSNMPYDTALSSVPYTHNNYGTPQSTSTSLSVLTADNNLPRNDSGTTTASNETSGTMTRQVSPNTMFGGVDALVESQDWWLRDQASLVLGFDNWMSCDGMGNGSGTSPDLTHLPSNNPASGFFTSNNLNGGGGVDAFADDEWYG